MEHKISVLKKGGVVATPAEAKQMGWELDEIVGIVLETPVIGLVVSLDRWVEQWGIDDGRVFHEDDEWTGDAQNLMDLSGLQLTKDIISWMEVSSKYEGQMFAAKRCAEYKKGGLEWYLPSAYELCTIAAFKDEIREAMVTIGVTDENTLNFGGLHWSSSEYTSSYAVTVNLDSGDLTNNGKPNSHTVRAVSAWNPNRTFISSHCEQSEQCAFDSLILSDEQLVAELKKRGYSGELTKTLKV